MTTKHKPVVHPMQDWFEMKFLPDLSDIRPEQRGYYKHQVHHFVTHYLTREKLAGKRVLDFGCGPGFYSAIFAQHGATVVGVDQNAFLIGKARELQARLKLDNVEFIHADLLGEPAQWNSGCFDYVIAIDTVVSFDYAQPIHNHARVSRAFEIIRKLLRHDGRFLIIESHPFFGQIREETVVDSGETVCTRPAYYKFHDKPATDPNHWFTLDEMTRATSENGLAILRILEPEPSQALAQENPAGFRFRVKYPGMIVYEICPVFQNDPNQTPKGETMKAKKTKKKPAARTLAKAGAFSPSALAIGKVAGKITIGGLRPGKAFCRTPGDRSNSDCGTNCKSDCGSNCKSDCGSNCKSDCGSNCKSDCGSNCKSDCGTNCKSDCGTSHLDEARWQKIESRIDTRFGDMKKILTKISSQLGGRKLR